MFLHLRKFFYGFILCFSAGFSWSQNIFTFCGNGTAGYSGDGSNAPFAEINSARGLTLDGSGNLIIADYYNNRIRKITPLGIISTIAGTGAAGYGGDGGPATSALLNGPIAVAVDKANSIYVVDYNNHSVRKINSSGTISAFAGNGAAGFLGDGGPATSAQFYFPSGVAVDTSGNVYVTDGGNHRVRKIDNTDTIRTMAGNGTAGYAGDSAMAVNAQINSPRGITVDVAGNVYFAEPTNQCIRQVLTTGMIRTFAGVGQTSGYSGDGGPAINATFDLPYGVKADTSGNIYVADFGNDCIRMVNKSGKISTIAGNGNQGFSGDKGLAVNARLNAPMDVVVANDKTIYIADFSNFRVRAICNGACFLGVGELKEDKMNVSLYPNPNNGNFNLSIDNEIENAELVVLNSLGQEMLRQRAGQGATAVNATALAKGFYYYKLMKDQQIVSSGKMVIE